MNENNTQQHDVLRSCPDCDLLQRVPAVAVGNIAKCCRCGAVLEKKTKNSINISLSLALTGLILFVLSNLFPILTLKAQGLQQEGTLLGASYSLFQSDQVLLGALVLLTTIVLPLFNLLSITFVLISVKFRFYSPLSSVLFRLILKSELWSMLEIFLLAVIVTGVKFGEVADIIQGLSLYAFIVMTLVLLYLQLVLNPRDVWFEQEHLL